MPASTSQAYRGGETMLPQTEPSPELGVCSRGWLCTAGAVPHSLFFLSFPFTLDLAFSAAMCWILMVRATQGTAHAPVKLLKSMRPGPLTGGKPLLRWDGFQPSSKTSSWINAEVHQRAKPSPCLSWMINKWHLRTSRASPPSQPTENEQPLGTLLSPEQKRTSVTVSDP